uniref:Uncharacterized protein n=1 Tax=Triticum urartu TaxID=4572 RepID=A0A8R7QDL0_TRIUA
MLPLCLNHFVCSQPNYGCPASPACCSSVY